MPRKNLYLHYLRFSYMRGRKKDTTLFKWGSAYSKLQGVRCLISPMLMMLLLSLQPIATLTRIFPLSHWVFVAYTAIVSDQMGAINCNPAPTPVMPNAISPETGVPSAVLKRFGSSGPTSGKESAFLTL